MEVISEKKFFETLPNLLLVLLNGTLVVNHEFLLGCVQSKRKREVSAILVLV